MRAFVNFLWCSKYQTLCSTDSHISDIRTRTVQYVPHRSVVNIRELNTLRNMLYNLNSHLCHQTLSQENVSRC